MRRIAVVLVLGIAAEAAAQTGGYETSPFAQCEPMVRALYGGRGDAYPWYSSEKMMAELAMRLRGVTQRLSEAALREATNIVEAAKCIEPAKGERWEEQIKPWVAKVEKAVAAEKECEATPACMAGRLLRNLCPKIAERAETQAEIAKQKKYAKRYGVIDLSELNEKVEAVKELDEVIADLKAQFRAIAKKPFSQPMCKAVE